MTEALPPVPAPEPDAPEAPEPEASVAARPPRRRWWLWALLASPLLLIAALLSLILFLPQLLPGERLRDEAMFALGELLGVSVRIEEVRYHPLTGAELLGLTVGPPEGFERDLFRARRLALRYDLSGLLRGRLAVREVALEDAHLVLETRGGQRNVDVIAARFASGAPETQEPEAPSAPLRGPLSPLELTLERLLLGPVRLELAGEGPHAELSGVVFRGSGAVTPERIDLGFELVVGPAEAEASNLRLALAAEDAAGQPLEATATLRFRQGLELAALGSDGLVVQRVGAGTHLELALATRWGASELSPLALGAEAALVLDGAADRLALERLELTLDETSIASGRFGVEGLHALLLEVMGAAPGEALAATLGLSPRHPTAVAKLELAHLALPLDTLAPHAAPFVPDLRFGGRLAVEELRVEGTGAELVAGTPAQLAGRISFDELTFAQGADLNLARLAGALELSRAEPDALAGGASPYALAGALELGRVRQGPTRVGSGRVELEVGVTALAHPPPGPLRARLAVALEDLVAEAATVGRVELEANVSGDDVLHAPRSAEVPVEVALRAAAARVRLHGGEELPEVVVLARARPLEVLAPSPAPIGFEVSVKAPRFVSPELAVVGLGLQLAGTVEDPRRGEPFDLTSSAELTIAEVELPQAGLQRLRLKLDQRFEGVAERRLPGPGKPEARAQGERGRVASAPSEPGPAGLLPARAHFDVELSIPRVVGKGAELVGFESALSATARVAADLEQGRAEIPRFDLNLGEALRVELSGRARRIFAPTPHLEVQLAVPRLDLEKTVALVPPALRGEARDLTATGVLSATLGIQGRAPGPKEALSLENVPFQGDLALKMEGVGLTSAALGLHVEALSGRLGGRVESGKATASADVTLARASQTTPEGTAAVEQLRLTTALGFDDRVWSVTSGLQARAVQVPGKAGEQGGAVFRLAATYPQRGDIDVRLLHVEVPAAGIELDASGRLRRQKFGTLRPELSVLGRIDLERLRAFVPELEGATGRLEARLDVRSPNATAADIEGLLTLDGVSFVAPDGLVLENATGRLPVAQRVVLPEPRFDLRVASARGAFEDDLEARLDELAARFVRARALLDAENILLVAPRTADHQAMRPYAGVRGAELRIERVAVGRALLEDVIMEGAWRSGVLRLDRLQTRLWEGDILGDLALQLTGDLNLRTRMRGTLTALNLDVPYAAAKGIPAVTKASQKELYKASATMDMAFALRERSVNGRVDVLRLSKPLVERLFGAIDPTGESAAVRALALSERAGVRPTSAKIWISHNLLNAQVDWERLWVHLHYESAHPVDLLLDTFFFFVRPVLIPTLGGLYVIPSVNAPIHRISISSDLEQAIRDSGLEAKLQGLADHVISGERAAVSAAAP